MAKRPRSITRTPSVLHPDAAGIDVGSREHWVAVPAERAGESVRCFRTFTADLEALAQWLSECGVRTVAMESTGVYWIPVYELLERRGFEVLLVDARSVRHVPVRKSDVLDCQWIQQLHSFGLLRASFRPDDRMVVLRSYARQRERWIRLSSRQILHMQKALNEMNVQLHHVLSDLAGVTGMRIVRALASGEYDPAVLAQFRDVRCRATQDEVEGALRGNLREEHLFALRQALELYDVVGEKIRACEAQIDRVSACADRGASCPPCPCSAQPPSAARQCATDRGARAAVCAHGRRGPHPDRRPRCILRAPASG